MSKLKLLRVTFQLLPPHDDMFHGRLYMNTKSYLLYTVRQAVRSTCMLSVSK